MKDNQTLRFDLLIPYLKNGVWVLGFHSFLFAIAERGLASFSDGYLSAIDLIQLFTASFLCLNWLCLKPEDPFESNDWFLTKPYQREELARSAAKERMIELQKQHLIAQEYILPFPFICQIYHLLNLKHLETIHYFSLGNLRVVKITDFQTTEKGGIVKFQTVLESSMNSLRIWRQPIVEVMLILHSLSTVELRIPVYNNKYIIVMFNVAPINEKEHKLFIDIYSNLNWPKPLLQIVLHFASCLTLLEDLPYLQKLAERNIHHLVTSSRISKHETMWLFKRFVELYGSHQEILALQESRV